MRHFGRLAILGIPLQPLPDDLYSLAVELTSFFEAYRERINRQPELVMSPDRASWLTMMTMEGTEAEKKLAAAKASFEISSLTDQQ